VKKNCPYCNSFNIAARRHPMKRANAEGDRAAADLDPARCVRGRRVDRLQRMTAGEGATKGPLSGTTEALVAARIGADPSRQARLNHHEPMFSGGAFGRGFVFATSRESRCVTSYPMQRWRAGSSKTLGSAFSTSRATVAFIYNSCMPPAVSRLLFSK